MSNVAPTRDLSDLVVIEIMPAQHRDSHRAARNWGAYPHNGAVRRVVDRVTAEEMVAADNDGYYRIIDNGDVSRYAMLSEWE